MLRESDSKGLSLEIRASLMTRPSNITVKERNEEHVKSGPWKYNAALGNRHRCTS
jgi:hypothetical protein